MSRSFATRAACGASAAGSAAAAIVLWRYVSSERSEHHSFKTALKQMITYDAMRIAGYFARRAHDRDCAIFAAVQAESLRARLLANQDTAYGRDHSFAAVLAAADAVEAFRETHPLTIYDHFAPYVDRVAAGEENVLNAEKETLLAATSGTSGRRALLPNTPTMSSTFFTRGILVLFDTLRRTCPAALSLQRDCKLTFAACWQESAGGLRIGPNSSGPKDKGFEKLLPLYSTPMVGYEIADNEMAALYVHALFALRDRKLGMLESNFLSLPYRLLALVERDGLRLADDIERGALDNDIANQLGAPLAARIDCELGRPNPQRAEEIRRALGDPAGTQGLALRLWPSLQLILANATGAFEGYARRLRDGSLQGVPILSTVFAASEGLMGISLAPREDGYAEYCLVPRAMFFEFLPIAAGTGDGAGTGNMKYGGTLLAHELTVGQDYELVVTNLGGLCRYRIGDVVRLAGYHEKAPVVEFRYRLGQVLNVRGEKMSERQLSAAVASALPAGCVADMTSAELTTGRAVPGYVVLVEGPAPVSASELAACAERLDRALGVENPVYATWRAKGAVAPCELVQAAPGAFDALRAARLAEGASPQQLKVSRVLRDPAHLRLLREHGCGKRA